MRSGATIGPIAEKVRAGKAADRVPLKTASCPVGFEKLMAAETGGLESSPHPEDL
jgi:hypothetical protein